ncbi:MAG: hypothetical protein L0H23_06945, partial [Luteimonas sp.]|nr:hypothetical protein [Luteimonas sp.]
MLQKLFLPIMLLAASVASGPVVSGDRSGDADSFGCKVCERKAAEVAQCHGIDAGEYFTGLVFNPPGMQTGYKRSSCFNRVARTYRDATLC